MSDEASTPSRDYLQRLCQGIQALHAILEPQALLQALLDQSLRAVRADTGSVALLNPVSGFLEVQASIPEASSQPRFLRLGEGLMGSVARDGRSLLWSGERDDDAQGALLPGESRSALATPLLVEGEVQGVVIVASARADAFSREDVGLLGELAACAAISIRNSWLYEQHRLKAGLFESLVNVSRAINSTLNLNEALDAVTREARTLMCVRMSSLMMLDEAGEWLDLRASCGAGEAYIHKPRVGVDDSLLGSVIRRRKPLQESNVQTSTRYQNSEVARRENLVSLLSVPLLFSGRAIGALNVYTDRPYVFSNDEIRVLSALAELSAVAIEKARLHERIVDAEEQLRQKEKLSALGWLAAEVAHEIRNPLTVLKMLYHSLDLRFPDGDPRNQDARIIADKIEHMNRIVERILDFARNVEPEFMPVDLNGIVEELGLLVRHKASQQGIRLECRLQQGLPAVSGDRTQLEQAFLNIVLNAAEAMPRGGSLVIATREQPSPGRSPLPGVAVEFSDTGQGIRPVGRKAGKVSMLNTTKKRGTGIGLAIVHRVVEAHHGRVVFSSRSGEGTVVTIWLPR